MRKDIPWLEYPPKKPDLLPRPICIPTELKIPVHFTVFTTNHTTASVVDVAALERQIKHTNQAFAPLNITFFIASINFHIGHQWRRFTQNKNGGDKDYYAYAERIKAENRYGKNDEVNIWVVESIDEFDCQTGVRTEGYCTLARNLAYPNHKVDGCSIVIDSLPGISWRGSHAGDGSTLTHELGHWLDLKHIFPSGANTDCKGESDGIWDTYQFPNNPSYLFEGKQPRCCPTGKDNYGISTWDYCPDRRPVNVTNWMSYSRQAGQYHAGDDPGTMPWTTEQRAHIFSAYYTYRRPAPDGKTHVTCSDYPVWYDQPPSKTRDLFRRAAPQSLSTRDLQGPNLLYQGQYLLEHLKTVCSNPPGHEAMKGIDVISGEVVSCSADGTCETPTSHARCPDGSYPPCKLAKYCPDGSPAGPHCETVQPCKYGHMPPCTDDGGYVWPEGTDHYKPPYCPPVSAPKHPEPQTYSSSTTLPYQKSHTPYPEAWPNPDPPYTTTYLKGPHTTYPPYKPYTTPDPYGKDPHYKSSSSSSSYSIYSPSPYPPGKGKGDPPYPDTPPPPSHPCPPTCNPHPPLNKCDATTAPTCIFPDPRVPHPRAACACRPGYKAYTDEELARLPKEAGIKQWRLPVKGQEHRVWVAEGVKCDVLCGVSSGIGACREVGEAEGGCVGYY